MGGYLRDPEEIYRRSFAAIRAETDLASVPGELAALALRIVHACGMPEILADLAWSDGAGDAGQAALTAGAPILCDAGMVAQGVIRARLPAANPAIASFGCPRHRGRDVENRRCRGNATCATSQHQRLVPCECRRQYCLCRLRKELEKSANTAAEYQAHLQSRHTPTQHHDSRQCRRSAHQCTL